MDKLLELKLGTRGFLRLYLKLVQLFEQKFAVYRIDRLLNVVL